eukprot:358524-Chlamydomonas_euryale.AAC.1
MGASINVPGFHLHYLSNDRQRGGHLLNCMIKAGATITVAEVRGLIRGGEHGLVARKKKKNVRGCRMGCRMAGQGLSVKGVGCDVLCGVPALGSAVVRPTRVYVGRGTRRALLSTVGPSTQNDTKNLRRFASPLLCGTASTATHAAPDPPRQGRLAV